MGIILVCVSHIYANRKKEKKLDFITLGHYELTLTVRTSKGRSVFFVVKKI